jgi:hypothetical protein
MATLGQPMATEKQKWSAMFFVVAGKVVHCGRSWCRWRLNKKGEIEVGKGEEKKIGEEMIFLPTLHPNFSSLKP